MTARHKRRKLTKDILFIAVPILSIVLFYVGLSFFLGTNTPLIVIAGGSMSPALEVGDLIVAKSAQPEEIKIGDIIVFDPPTEGMGQTVHRVIAVQPLANGTLTFKTKGDANDIEDQYTLYPRNIRAMLLYRIPYIGYVLLNPLILITIITVIVVLIVIWPEKKRGIRRRHKKRQVLS